MVEGVVVTVSVHSGTGKVNPAVVQAAASLTLNLAVLEAVTVRVEVEVRWTVSTSLSKVSSLALLGPRESCLLCPSYGGQQLSLTASQ